MIQSLLQRIHFNLVIAVAMTVCSVAVHALFVDPEWTGTKIMEESDNRHQQFPFIYEEQTMVLIDSAGHRNVRRLRRYTRLEDNGEVKFLLVFDDPENAGCARRRSCTRWKRTSWRISPSFRSQYESP